MKVKLITVYRAPVSEVKSETLIQEIEVQLHKTIFKLSHLKFLISYSLCTRPHQSVTSVSHLLEPLIINHL